VVQHRQSSLEYCQRAQHIDFVVRSDIIESRFGSRRKTCADAGVGNDKVEMGDSLGLEAGNSGRWGRGVGAINMRDDEIGVFAAEKAG